MLLENDPVPGGYATVAVGTDVLSAPAAVNETVNTLPKFAILVSSVPIVVVPEPPLLIVTAGALAPSRPYPPPGSVMVNPVTV